MDSLKILDAQINEATSAYQQIQNELASAVETRQKLAAQLTENENVKKEFGLLTPNNTIYKLIGGCLIKQEHDEAKQNVDKRIEFIGSELKKLEANIQSINDKSEAAKLEVVRLQTELQAKTQTQPAGAPPAQVKV